MIFLFGLYLSSEACITKFVIAELILKFISVKLFLYQNKTYLRKGVSLIVRLYLEGTRML